jgi:hypothetical protein
VTTKYRLRVEADRRTNDGDQHGTAREITDGENENVEVAERVHRYI